MRDVSEAAYIETGLVGASRRRILSAAETPQGHLAEMDVTGVDVAVMLPTFAPFLVFDDRIGADLSRAYARAYNRWLGTSARSRRTGSWAPPSSRATIPRRWWATSSKRSATACAPSSCDPTR